MDRWRLLYYHPSCNVRFLSSCKANASHGAVRGRGDVAVQSASDATRVSAFSEAFTEAVIGGEVTQVAARRLPM